MSECRYCGGLKRWNGDVLPEPLRLGEVGILEAHCGYDGAPSPRFSFVCPVCNDGHTAGAKAERDTWEEEISVLCESMWLDRNARDFLKKLEDAVAIRRRVEGAD